MRVTPLAKRCDIVSERTRTAFANRADDVGEHHRVQRESDAVTGIARCLFRGAISRVAVRPGGTVGKHPYVTATRTSQAPQSRVAGRGPAM